MRKNLPLIVGLAIPVLMIIFVALAVYLPTFLAHPKYGFVFSTGDTYASNYGNHYSVVDGKIVKTTVPDPKKPELLLPYPNTNAISLFVYDPKIDNVRSITFAEAEKLNVDISPKSPDGYTLERGDSNGGIFELFGSNRDYNSWYLKSGLVSKKIYLTSPSQSYYYNGYGQFLGWIINNDSNTK